MIRAGLGDSLRAASGSIADLRAQVQPGFGALTDARVTAIRDAAAESIGNLRDSLARRGVMGSSFADDAVTRTRLAFSREEQTARSEAKIAEIGLTSELTQQQFTNELNSFAQQLGLSGFEASLYQQNIANLTSQVTLAQQELTRYLQEFGVAGNLANGVAAAVSQQGIAQAQLQLLSQQQAGRDSAGAIASISGGLKDLGKVFSQNQPTVINPDDIVWNQ